MASLTGPIPFLGSIGSISAYKRRDLDKVIIRTKGGATKEQIKKKPSFQNTRNLNKEWQGVTAMSRAIRQNIHLQKHLADYNFTGTINALCKKMEYADTINEFGKRSVLLSQCRYLLEGFSLNNRIIFDSVLRQPIECTLDRTNNSVQLKIPPIYPTINFINPGKNPLYRFVLMLGFVSDLVFETNINAYKTKVAELPAPVFSNTEWVSVQKKAETAGIILQATKLNALDEAVTMIVSVGIEFGIPVADASIEYVKYSGAAKLLKLG
jgi:hypothetical protein